MDFKCFIDMDHVSQPRLSNWCWAACIEKLINGLNIDSEIGEKQHKIVHHYLNKYLGIHIGITDENLFYNKFSNVGLEPNHLECVFKDAGILCTPIENDKLFQYSFVKKTLNELDMPILFQSRFGNGYHLELITGFGDVNDCEYLLIGNPILSIGEKYELIQKFKKDYTDKIIKVWSCQPIKEKLIRETNLIPDTKFYWTYHNQFTEVKKYFKENGLTGRIKVQDILDTLTSNSDEEKFFEPKDVISDKIICRQDYRRGLVNKCPIDNINISFKCLKNDELYLTDYGVRLKIFNNDSTIKVLSAPINYNLNDYYENYRDLAEILNNIDKVNY